jgi:uncharacterized protein YjbI with pentapeptide repeats
MKARRSRSSRRLASPFQPEGDRTSLVRASMRGANLTGVVLHGADLFQADLIEADLSKADLGSSRLLAAKLFNTNQTDTRFSGAIMPDNSVHP